MTVKWQFSGGSGANLTKLRTAAVQLLQLSHVMIESGQRVIQPDKTYAGTITAPISSHLTNRAVDIQVIALTIPQIYVANLQVIARMILTVKPPIYR